MTALDEVVDLEASRLLDRAKSGGLTPEDMEALETLCRCAKILRAAVPGEPPEPTEEEELAVLEEALK